MIVLVISIFFGIVPMLIYAGILWWLDRWEKEPLPLLGSIFLWGFIPSACFALITQIILDVPVQYVFSELYFSPIGADIVGASIIAPLTEEFIKGAAVLLVFVLYRREFDSVLDGIIYGSLVGFGFAAIENILYFSTAGGILGCLIFLRAFLFGLNHAFFTSLTGIGFALARFRKGWLGKLTLPVLGLITAMAAHGLHNFLVSVGPIGFPIAILADWMGALGVLIIAVISLVNEARWIRTYLAAEVEQGVLTAAQAATVSSFTGRIAAGWRAAARGPGYWRKNRRFYKECAELAFKKHQRAKVGDRERNAELITKIRAEVVKLSQELS
ncbi:MAG: PrsW family intramembrane metalloprotease [Anaerolineales bacterium]